AAPSTPATGRTEARSSARRPIERTCVLPLPDGEPSPLGGREVELVPDEGAVQARAGPDDQNDVLAAGSQEAIQRLRSRRHDPALDARDRRLGHPRSPGQLALREPGPNRPPG